MLSKKYENFTNNEILKLPYKERLLISILNAKNNEEINNILVMHKNLDEIFKMNMNEIWEILHKMIKDISINERQLFYIFSIFYSKKLIDKFDIISSKIKELDNLKEFKRRKFKIKNLNEMLENKKKEVLESINFILITR